MHYDGLKPFFTEAPLLLISVSSPSFSFDLKIFCEKANQAVLKEKEAPSPKLF